MEIRRATFGLFKELIGGCAQEEATLMGKGAQESSQVFKDSILQEQ